MKKLIALFLTLALLLSLVCCMPAYQPDSDVSNSLPETLSRPTSTASTAPDPSGSSTIPSSSNSPVIPEPPVSSVVPTPSDPIVTEPSETLDPDGFYYSKEDVALYIHLYGCLPDNFITKSEASDYGGTYKAMQNGYRIGGDTFQNREGLLPKKSGRRYTECDIVAPGVTSRGARRIVFSNDGLVYYTDDHYSSFTLLYGEP